MSLHRYLLYAGVFFWIFLLDTSLHASTDVQVKYLFDKTHRYSVKDIYQYRESFHTIPPEKNTFGLQETTVWIYLKINNLSDEESANMIEFPYPLLDYIEVMEYENSRMVDRYLTGDMTAFNTRKIISNTFVIPYIIKAKSTKEFILKVNSEGALNLKMQFYTQSEYHDKARYRFMVLGIYYGTVLIMLIYNLFLYFMIKEKVYLHYVVFHFSYLFLQLGFNGIGFEYLWPNQPWINAYYVLEMIIICSYLSVIFSVSFLDIEQEHPKIYSYFKNLNYFFLFIMVLIFFLPYNLMVKIVIVASTVSALSLFITGIYILIKFKTVSSKFYVTAWTLLLMGVLLLEFQNIGLLPVNIITLYGSQIGAFLELALLSLALAYRYNILFVKLKQTESNLRGFNEALEEKVVNRTKVVNEKNLALSREINNKNILLKELFHRVKNNLQIVSGLLALQSNRIKDSTVEAHYADTIQRIRSMSIVHEKMYQSENLELVDIQMYVGSLVDEIRSIFRESDIVFHILCDEIHLKIDRVIPLGLIMNEIITNSMKYAFDEMYEGEKIIEIVMHTDISDKVTLYIRDNGKGLDEVHFQSGFGFKLIESLVGYQLRGEVSYLNDNGLIFTIVFKK